MVSVILRTDDFWVTGTDGVRTSRDPSFNKTDDYYVLQKYELKRRLEEIGNQTLADLERKLGKIKAMKDSHLRVLFGCPYILEIKGEKRICIGSHEPLGFTYLGDLAE